MVARAAPDQVCNLVQFTGKTDEDAKGNRALCCFLGWVFFCKVININEHCDLIKVKVFKKSKFDQLVNFVKVNHLFTESWIKSKQVYCFNVLH